jgi:hypothetical protein
MKDVLITMVEKEMSPGQDIHGMIDIKYSGRFDSIVINSQIENSNDIFTYTDLNGKKINYPYARLPIFKDDIGTRKMLEFIATTKHVPASKFSNAKFRVTIIQEHKEIASDVTYIKIIK